MGLWSDDDAQAAGDNIARVKDNLSGLSETQLATLRHEAAIVESGKNLELVKPGSISQSDLVRMLPAGHLVGLEGQAFVDAARDALKADAMEQRQFLRNALEKGQEGAQEGLDSMSAAAAQKFDINPEGTRGLAAIGQVDITPTPAEDRPPNKLFDDPGEAIRSPMEKAAINPPGTRDLGAIGEVPMTTAGIVEAEQQRYQTEIRPEIEAALSEAPVADVPNKLFAKSEQKTSPFVDKPISQEDMDSIRADLEGAPRAQPSPMATAAVIPAGLTAEEAAAWQAFNSPQQQPDSVAPPVPTTRPTVEERIDAMADTPAPPPLSAELGGPQGTVTSQSTIVQAGDTPWGISKAMLEMDHQSRGLPPPNDAEIAAFNNAMLKENGITVDANGVAIIQEGQELKLPQIIDLDGLKRQDSPTQAPEPVVAAAPPPAPVMASPAPEPVAAPQEEKTDYVRVARNAAMRLGFGGAVMAIEGIAGAIKEYAKSDPPSADRSEQGMDVREEMVLGNLAKPVTPMAKGADRSMGVA